MKTPSRLTRTIVAAGREPGALIHASLFTALMVFCVGCNEPTVTPKSTEGCVSSRFAKNEPIQIVAPITNKDVMRLIDRLPTCPSTESAHADLSSVQWLVLLKTADVLQSFDSDVQAYAIHDFIVHAKTAFEPDVDYVEEWSKVMLLLRVMFDVEANAPQDGPKAFGGWGWGSVATRNGASPDLECPVGWGKRGPFIRCVLASYNGPQYEGEEEFWYLRQNFPLRKNLEVWIHMLERARVSERN